MCVNVGAGLMNLSKLPQKLNERTFSKGIVHTGMESQRRILS